MYWCAELVCLYSCIWRKLFLLQGAGTGRAGRSAVSSWPEEEVVDLVEDADDEGTVSPVSCFLILFSTTVISKYKSPGPDGIIEMPERSHIHVHR